MRKGKKKIFIGIGAAAVVLGGAAVAANSGSGEVQIPSIPVVRVEKGDVEQVVDAAGTVVSEEQKTYFSPVNAKISKLSFEQGDTIKAGTKLIEFDLKDLKKENQKANLGLKSDLYGYQDSMNKSDKADKKYNDAKENVKTLEKQVQDKKEQVKSLKAQIQSVTAQAQRSAQAAAEEQARQAQAAAAAEAEAARRAQEQQQMELQRAYAEALASYQNITLPNYQNELGQLNARVAQALTEYNQADTAYQMAFSVWQNDPVDENAQALSVAETNRSNAEIAYNQAKEAYELKKTQQPPMPTMADVSGGGTGDFLTDGTDSGTGTEDYAPAGSYDSGSGSASYSAPDTSGLENALEEASSDLAELQSKLASEKAIAEADPTSLTKEEKEKMKISTNLTEMDAKTAEELVEEGKKGITADFNGVVSKSGVVDGASVSQGMELLTIQNIDKVSVDINISKYDYDKVKEGQEAEITMADRTYHGTVTKISHIAMTNEKGASVITATVKIDDPDENIFLGVDAKVKIHAATAEDVVTIPVEVVNIGKDGSFCYVIEDGVIARRDITTGLSSEEYIEVTEGLEAGDEVVSDLGGLTEGMQAQPQAEMEAGADE